MDDDTKQKIQQLQMLEQSMQAFLGQKQQFQAQLLETENALREVSTAKKAYKIVGSVMIDRDTKELAKELEDRKSTIELRIKTLEKQEEKIKEKAQSMQQDVMKKLQKNEK